VNRFFARQPLLRNGWRAHKRLARGVAVVAVAALVGGGGCGDDDTVTAPGPGPTPTVATVPGGAPAPTPTSSPAGGGDPGTTAATTAGGATTPTIAPDEGTEAPPTLDADVPAGHFAAALLRPEASERLALEIHADAQPDAAAIQHVANVLGDVSGKPVSVTAGGAPGGGDRAWTADELRAAADAGSPPQGGGTAIVRLLFVHGTFEGDDGVLGVAVRGDVAAIFLDRVAAAGGLLGAADAIETAVVTHEVGHLLGLVDLARDTGRADPEHPGHSANPGSVMYWAVESDLIGQVLGADPPNEFDADDLADLAAIRSGG
jgi:hypothetical protein